LDKGYWQEAMNERPINTCCPACHTLFNVTTGQLKMAAGVVRCGACLHVFNATEPAVTTTSASLPAESKKHQAKKQANKNTQTYNTSITISDERIEWREPSNTPDSPLARYSAYAGIVLLLLLLAAQTLWFQRTQWLQKDVFRPIYQTLYALNDKVLPTRIAPDLIHTKKFIIQPHDELVDAIRISILLENQADFPQAFPGLQLIFSDLKGHTTAQRTLRADDYIDKNLFPNHLIPSKQPIQIQLDMMNPGNRAVSYQLNLLSR
jgi:predicted Zn finger-like uncharacterized protein